MSERKFQGPPRVKNAMDESKLKITGEPLQSGYQRPTVQPQFVKNQPRLILRTGVPNDKDYGRIQWHADQPTFYAMLEMLEDAIESKEQTRFSVSYKKTQFYNGERSKTPEVESTLYVGKDEKGVVYISIIHAHKDRPKVKISFAPAYYHEFGDKDGPLDEARASVYAARAWLINMRLLLAGTAATNYVEPEPRDGNKGGGYKGGGNGGGQGGGQGGGSGWKPEADGGDFDDIPF